MAMTKITLYITEQQKEMLRTIAFEKRTTSAELIRQAIEGLIKKEHAKIRIVKATAEIKENAPQQEVAESAEIKETVQPENNTDKKGTQTTIINLAGRINEQLAKRAKENISFSDYKTGSATAEYNQHMSEVLTAIENAKTKVSDEGKERLDRLYSRHAANYAKWINKHNANGASHVSVMIAGPSNYNMRKHEQYLNREGRLWEEYDKLKDIFWNINSIVDGDKIIKSGDPSAIEKLKEKLSNALKEHQEYKDYNAKARKEGTEQLAPYILQNSNGRIKSIRDRIARLERAKQQGTKEIEVKTNDAETIRIVDNVDVYRIQIFFPGKPDAEVRTKLKKNGFRWAPSVSAWQAHRNRYNLDKAKEIISSI